MHLTDIEYEFDNLLNDATSGRRSPAECMALCQDRYPDLVASLELALALRNTTLDTAETDSARTRVRQTLDALLDQDEEASATIVNIRSRFRPRWKSAWLVVVACAVLMMVALAGNRALSAAAADALPGSPLYAIKRLDEDVQLRLAWSDSAHAEALATIAIHRLDEARAEAARNNTIQALSLMRECDAATHQLIGLVITTRYQHQDDATVTHALAQTLQAEYDALQQAQSNGQSALAQALTTTVAGQQSTLSASNIQIPLLTTPVPTAPVATQPTPATHPTQEPHATPTHKPTATPKANSGNGNHGGNNGGNGNNGGGQDYGKGDLGSSSGSQGSQQSNGKSKGK